MFKLGKYNLTAEQYIKCYKKILLIRRFEEKCGQCYSNGLIGGFCHLYIGQEAVVVGFNICKKENDSVITSYRDHAHALMSGMDACYVMAELTGREHGCSKGKGGSMHMFNIEKKFYGGHAIVGAQVSIGTGLAFTEKYNESNNICYTFLGDGAVNQGQVYESFNMASLWKLPIIYIIENNKYSMGTSVDRSTSIVDLYKKGLSFGIAGVQVDGMNLEEIYDVALQASDFVRSGNGPIIVEAKTYRYRGHSMSDPSTYRTKDEVKKYKDKDVVDFVRMNILSKKYASEQELNDIEKKIKLQIAEVVEFAKNSPLPQEQELYSDIYK